MEIEIDVENLKCCGNCGHQSSHVRDFESDRKFGRKFGCHECILHGRERQGLHGNGVCSDHKFDNYSVLKRVKINEKSKY